MAIRLPLKTVLSWDANGEDGTNSVNGVLAKSFTIPQDCDNILVKFKASTVGGAFSAQLQTSDDGGTTWFGVARTSIVSNANGDKAEWLSVPVNGFGIRSGEIVASTVCTGSVFSWGSVNGTIGNAYPSNIGQRQQTGLPILGLTNRVALQITGDVTAAAVLMVEVKVNSQSATA